MNKLICQLGWVILASMLLSACSVEGDLPVPAEVVPDPVRTPLPDPTFTPVNRFPFIAKDSLYSWNESDNSATLIASSADNIMVTLNTVSDPLMNVEKTVYSQDDNIFVVDHATGEIKLLTHFNLKVCEILPSEIIDTSTNGAGTVVTLTRLHEELVYVVAVSGTNCGEFDQMKFFKLPLIHEQGDVIETVSESEARAQMILAQVDNPDTTTVGDKKIVSGFLGYSYLDKKLRFYDQDRQLVWEQDRTLKQFSDAAYYLHLQALSHYQYLLQLGEDIFVFDSGDELFTNLNGKSFDADTMLSDKVHSVTPSSKTPEVQIIDDGSQLYLENIGQIFSYTYYTAPTSAPSSPVTYEVVPQNKLFIDAVDYSAVDSFSQFSLKACDVTDTACVTAHDFTQASWQFITDCTSTVGCTLFVDTSNDCDISSTDPSTRCSATNYTHLSELDQPGNNASFLGYMQYQPYIKNTKILANGSKLDIVAHMDEKSVLVEFDTTVALTAAKNLRETTLLGDVSQHDDIDAFLSGSDLYINRLDQVSSETRCTKGGKTVTCELSDTTNAGTDTTCTGKDITDNKCSSKDYNWYQYHAMLNSTEVSSDAFWTNIYDNRDQQSRMYLVTGTLSTSEGEEEGVLTDASLGEYDKGSNTVTRKVPAFSEPVKGSTFKGWILDDKLGRFDLINVSGGNKLNIYYYDPFDAGNSADSSSFVSKAGETTTN